MNQNTDKDNRRLASQANVLLTTPEAASHLRVSKSYLDKLRCFGGGPEFIRLGRKVLYRLSALESWAEQHRHRSTSEYEKS